MYSKTSGHIRVVTQIWQSPSYLCFLLTVDCKLDVFTMSERCVICVESVVVCTSHQAGGLGRTDPVTAHRPTYTGPAQPEGLSLTPSTSTQYSVLSTQYTSIP